MVLFNKKITKMWYWSKVNLQNNNILIKYKKPVINLTKWNGLDVKKNLKKYILYNKHFINCWTNYCIKL